MKVVLALDSFKGSMSSLMAGEAAALGVKDAIPDAEVTVCPIADGGEGTVEAIVYGAGGEYRSVRVRDPLGREITAEYGILPSGTAVMEMSRASGITLVSRDELDPMMADTFGVGEMLLDAIGSGARRIIIGIGGSATNDGGVGMLRALGFRFLDKEGNDIPRGAAGLAHLSKIDTSGARSEIPECEILVASDVKNPLTGELGATYVYGRQKGATDEMLPLLDSYLCTYAEKTREVIKTADPSLPGSGAAGGLGFALVSYLGAKLTSGIDLVMETVALEEKIKSADVVVTGEGRMDAQSAMGKVPFGVARIAKKYGKTVIALGGSLGSGFEELYSVGVDAVFPIVPRPMTLDDAINVNNACQNMRNTARNVFNLIGTRL